MDEYKDDMIEEEEDQNEINIQTPKDSIDKLSDTTSLVVKVEWMAYSSPSVKLFEC